MLEYKEIGARIRKQRELLGYTREDLAEKIDKSIKFCSDIELGVKGMSLETLCLISSVLLLPTDYILFGKTYNINRISEINSLLMMCDNSDIPYLVSIIRSFIQATNKKSSGQNQI